jgi:transposase
MAPGFETPPLGSHTKMKLISRQAYGFRNFKNTDSV